MNTLKDRLRGRASIIIAALFFIIFISPAIPAAAGEAPDPYLDFAKHLFNEGDYYRTITEAKRFIFLNPDDARRVEAEILIARAYFEAGKYEQARQAYLPVIKQTQRPDLSAKALIEFGKCLERLGLADDAAAFYKGLAVEPSLPTDHKEDISNIARYRLGWMQLERGNWTAAGEAFDSVSTSHRLKSSAMDLADKSLQGNDLSFKSPTTAGVLSGILPGAGQLYNGRPVDAALAFGLNAAFLYGTVEAYNSENWAVFTLLGLMEIGWYGGNIYNAVNGAHIHNREVKEEFIKRLRREHGWRLGYAPKNKGFVLSWTASY